VDSAVLYRIQVRNVLECKALLTMVMKFDVTYQTRDVLIC